MWFPWRSLRLCERYKFHLSEKSPAFSVASVVNPQEGHFRPFSLARRPAWCHNSVSEVRRIGLRAETSGPEQSRARGITRGRRKQDDRPRYPA